MNDTKRIGKEEAIQIIYYLMSVDGHIEQCETIFFDKIAEAFGVDDSNAWKEAAEKTEKILSSTSELSTLYKKIYLRVNKLFAGQDDNIYWESSISSYLLVWNMMVLAIKDMEYSANELKLINYVAERLEIDLSILAEMDNAIRALYAIQNEMKWLKDNIGVGDELEKALESLEKRTKVIEDNVKMLFIREEV